MLIHNTLKCKTNKQGPQPLKALEDGNLKDFNAQTKPKIDAKSPSAWLVQIGQPKCI